MTTKREIIDTIEYVNTRNEPVVITLVRYGKTYTVETNVNGRVSTRGFASEAQANTFIANSQR